MERPNGNIIANKENTINNIGAKSLFMIDYCDL